MAFLFVKYTYKYLQNQQTQTTVPHKTATAYIVDGAFTASSDIYLTRVLHISRRGRLSKSLRKLRPDVKYQFHITDTKESVKFDTQYSEFSVADV